MNKKQLIAAWSVVIIISLVCISSSTRICGGEADSILAKYSITNLSTIDIAIKTILVIIPVLLIGCLLIYSLKDRRK